jgi:hypothetical protein
VLAVVLGVLALAGSASAGPASQGDVAAADAVANKVTYQGRLTDPEGNPLNGNFNLKFEMYDALSGGNKLGEQIRNGTPVQNGLFTVYLNTDPAHYDGKGLWVAITVNGQLLSPRQELLPVPFALGLWPGANVVGNRYDASILRVENTDPNPAGGGYAIWARNASGHTWRPAIYGENTGASAGVYGRSDGWHATVGWQNGSNAAFAGVYGYNGKAGPGVFGESLTGYAGVYGKSTDGYGVVGESSSDVAVFGSSSSGKGGLFASMTGTGVYASSNAGPGLEAYSRDGVALYAHSACCDLIKATGTSSGDTEFRVTNTGEVYADGTFHSGGADLAEMLPAQDGLGPGDVLVIGSDGELLRSTVAYATNVVGVYSTNPGFVGGQPAEDPEAGTIPLAIVGIVPVKVTAENGAIVPGDLLVASSTAGYAMKAGANPPQGTVIGKAMEKLDTGSGVIRMLATLQ